MATSNEGIGLIGVDFDGTLVEGIWPDRGIGPDIPGAQAKLQDVVDYAAVTGERVCIYTARGWGDAPLIREWLDKRGFDRVEVQCGKLLLRYLVDDRVLNAESLSWVIP